MAGDIVFNFLIYVYIYSQCKVHVSAEPARDAARRFESNAVGIQVCKSLIRYNYDMLLPGEVCHG